MSCQFLGYTMIYHRTKNQERLMNHCQGKSRTDRQKGRQTHNSDFIGSYINGGPIKGALRADTIN